MKVPVCAQAPVPAEHAAPVAAQSPSQFDWPLGQVQAPPAHAPPDGEPQALPSATAPQTPSALAPAATLQAWQSWATLPPQADRQQTPSTQNSEEHCESEVHDSAIDSAAAIEVVEDAEASDDAS